MKEVLENRISFLWNDLWILKLLKIVIVYDSTMSMVVEFPSEKKWSAIFLSSRNHHNEYLLAYQRFCSLFYAKQSWEATVTGDLQTGGFQMGYCNIENSAFYFVWKLDSFISLKSKKNTKEGAVLKV